MSIPVQAVSPEAMEEARRLYEQTNVPLHTIAVGLGIGRWALSRRVRLWGWTPRARRIPLTLPPRAAAGSTGASDRPPPPPEAVPRRAMIARLMTRIEAELATVEQLLAHAGRASDGTADTERAARTLAILVRSLRELAALERGQAPDDEEAERDAGAYRRELEATLERVLAGGAAA